MVKTKLILLSLFAVNLAGSYELCPKISSDKVVIMRDVNNKEDLIRQIDCIRKVPLRKLVFINFKLNDPLPRGLFNDTNIRTLIIKNSRIKSLVPPRTTGVSAFNGLENHLKRFIVVKPDKTVFNWDWKQLAGLTSLEMISIANEALSENKGISDRFNKMNLSNLKWILITGVCMTHLKPDCFAPFVSVTRITLQGNEIKFIEADSFARPAAHLTHLDLSHNRIEILPFDFFEYMPVIEVVNLSYNKLADFHAIQYALTKLKKLFVYGNNLDCCTASWLTNATTNGNETNGPPFYEDGVYPLSCIRESDKANLEIKRLTKDQLNSCPRHSQPPYAPPKFHYLQIEKCYLPRDGIVAATGQPATVYF